MVYVSVLYTIFQSFVVIVVVVLFLRSNMPACSKWCSAAKKMKITIPNDAAKPYLSDTSSNITLAKGHRSLHAS